MKLILEHFGDERHTKIANNVKHMVEHYLGHEVEHTIGRNQDDLELYNEDLKSLGTFNTEPSLETISLMVELNS